MIRVIGGPLARHMADLAKLVAADPTFFAGAVPPAATCVSGAAVTDRVVPPGLMASFAIQGYCLDSRVGAPNRGDQLHLVPVGARIPATLAPVYEGLGHWARLHPREENLIQSAYWALAHAGTTNPYARPAPQTQRVLDEAYPGGAAIQANYHATEAMKAQVLGALLRQAGVDRLPGMDALLRGDVAGATEQLMRQRIAEGQRMPGPKGHGYSWIAPGVAARAVGSGPLRVDIQVLNLSGQAFRFIPAHYVAQPVARMQPVGLPARVMSTGAELAGAVNHALTANERWLRAVRGHIGALAQSLRDFLSRPLFAGAFDWAFERPRLDLSTNRLLGLVREGDRRFMLKTAVDASPVIGNLLSLHEAVSGTDWLYGQALTPLERTLLVAAAAPGANALWKTYTTVDRLVKSGAVAVSPAARKYLEVSVNKLGEFVAGGGAPGFLRDFLYLPARQVGEFSRAQGNVERRAEFNPDPAAGLFDQAINLWNWIGNDRAGQFSANPAERAVLRELAPHWDRVAAMGAG